MVWKFEWMGNHLRVSSKGWVLSPKLSPTVLTQRHDPEKLASLLYRADTHRARLYRARDPAAAASSSRCRRLGQTILQTPAPPPHNMSAAAAARTAAAA